MKRSMTIAAALLIGLLLSGCASANAEAYDHQVFDEVSDLSGHEQLVQREHQKRAFAMAAYEAKTAVDEVIDEEAEYESEWVDDGAYSDYGYVGYRGDPDTLNNFDGTYKFDGRTESFYSGDNAEYRGDLWVDDDGFYRTEEGYYAVAVNKDDMSKGDTFEGSQGTCVVVDDGADPGITDYAVSGWY